MSERVENKQVAPAILKALDLEPEKLEAVRKEHTRMLPALDLKENENNNDKQKD